MHYLGGAADGQTPLDPDEAAQILRPAVTTLRELDLVEQENIAQATMWALGRKRQPQAVLDEPFLRRLHKRMFGDVWRWAGTYRQTPRNIGVEPWLIAQELGGLIGDTRYWVEHDTYELVELTVRFHHRLVAIHAFPNGNGRHARLAADILAVSLGRTPLGWGRGLAFGPADLRAIYIAALQAADQGELTDLIAFARS
jgi:Fic-DOC domain mobile mystery protein B